MTAETWEKLKRRGAAGLYDAARMRAVTAAVLRAGPTSELGAADAAAEADRAMVWLKEAVAAGYTDAARLKRDKDLDSLRERADFRSLLAALAARDRGPGIRQPGSGKKPQN